MLPQPAPISTKNSSSYASTQNLSHNQFFDHLHVALDCFPHVVAVLVTRWPCDMGDMLPAPSRKRGRPSLLETYRQRNLGPHERAGVNPQHDEELPHDHQRDTQLVQARPRLEQQRLPLHVVGACSGRLHMTADHPLSPFVVATSNARELLPESTASASERFLVQSLQPGSRVWHSASITSQGVYQSLDRKTVRQLERRSASASELVERSLSVELQAAPRISSDGGVQRGRMLKLQQRTIEKLPPIPRQ